MTTFNDKFLELLKNSCIWTNACLFHLPDSQYSLEHRILDEVSLCNWRFIGTSNNLETFLQAIQYMPGNIANRGWSHNAVNPFYSFNNRCLLYKKKTLNFLKNSSEKLKFHAIYLNLQTQLSDSYKQILKQCFDRIHPSVNVAPFAFSFVVGKKDKKEMEEFKDDFGDLGVDQIPFLRPLAAILRHSETKKVVWCHLDQKVANFADKAGTEKTTILMRSFICNPDFEEEVKNICKTKNLAEIKNLNYENYKMETINV